MQNQRASDLEFGMRSTIEEYNRNKYKVMDLDFVKDRRQEKCFCNQSLMIYFIVHVPS